MGEIFAKWKKLPIKHFIPDWKHKSAGVLRNEKMAEYAEAALILWDGKSRGTLDMINRAHKHGLKLFVWTVL